MSNHVDSVYLLEILGCLGYNKNRKLPGVYDDPAVLNLHYFLRDSIYQEYVRPPFAVEDRKLDEVTHLASVRRQKAGNGTLGINRRTYKRRLLTVFFCFIVI